VHVFCDESEQEGWKRQFQQILEVLQRTDMEHSTLYLSATYVDQAQLTWLRDQCADLTVHWLETRTCWAYLTLNTLNYLYRMVKGWPLELQAASRVHFIRTSYRPPQTTPWHEWSQVLEVWPSEITSAYSIKHEDLSHYPTLLGGAEALKETLGDAFSVPATYFNSLPSPLETLEHFQSLTELKEGRSGTELTRSVFYTTKHWHSLLLQTTTAETETKTEAPTSAHNYQGVWDYVERMHQQVRAVSKQQDHWYRIWTQGPPQEVNMRCLIGFLTVVVLSLCVTLLFAHFWP